MTEEDKLQNASQDELVSVYVYTLMEDKGENPDDAEAHMAVKQQVMAAVNDAIIDALPEDKVEELNKLFEQNEATPDKMAEIVAESGVDTQMITEEVLDKFRADYLGESESNETETEEHVENSEEKEEM